MLTREQANANYRVILDAARRDNCRQRTIAELGKRDLFYLLTRILHRPDADNDFVYERCREYQADPDGNLDLWAREHYKTTIITFADTIRQMANNPEMTKAIFSFNRPAAKKFLRQIKVELETNRTLQELYPETFYRDPQKESPKWSEDDGLVIKRRGNPKEGTLEAHGLTDGQPTGSHFSDLHYEDVVVKDSVRTPAMIMRTTESLQESLNLGIRGGRRRGVGTRWHYADTWGVAIESGIFKPRIWTATQDGTFEGEPWLLTREELQRKISDMGPYVAACQLFLEPKQESLQGFQQSWLRFWRAQRTKGLNVYILCDPASAKKSDSDYTVFIVIGLGADRNYYVLRWIRDRLSLTERANVLFKLHQEYRPVAVGYERYGMQSDIEHFQDRMERDNYRFTIVAMAGPLSKPSRIDRLVPLFHAGRVFIPDSSPYTQYDGQTLDLTQAFINDEYLAHPFEVHDDMLDCLARVLDEELSAVFPQGQSIDPLQVGGPPEADYDPLRYGLQR